MRVLNTFPRGNARPQLSEGQIGTSYWKCPTTEYRSGMIWLGRDQHGDPVGVEDNRHVVTVAGNRAGKTVASDTK